MHKHMYTYCQLIHRQRHHRMSCHRNTGEQTIHLSIFAKKNSLIKKYAIRDLGKVLSFVSQIGCCCNIVSNNENIFSKIKPVQYTDRL